MLVHMWSIHNISQHTAHTLLSPADVTILTSEPERPLVSESARSIKVFDPTTGPSALLMFSP